MHSPFNFGGYHSNPQATAEVLRDGRYHRGDLACRVGRERFVTCRKKELLIVGGVSVWPQALESVPTAVDGLHPGRAVAFAEFDPAHQTERVVVLCETDASPVQQRALVLAVRRRILAALQLANFEVHLVPPGWPAHGRTKSILPATATLPLPRCHCHDATATLPLPRCQILAFVEPTPDYTTRSCRHR